MVASAWNGTCWKSAQRWSVHALVPHRDRRTGGQHRRIARAGFDLLVDGENGDPKLYKPVVDTGVLLMKRVVAQRRWMARGACSRR